MNEIMQEFTNEFCEEILMQSSDKQSLNSLDSDAIEFVTSSKDSHFVPIKISKDELLKAHRCQKAMLEYMFKRYTSAIGTEKEDFMRKMYNDSLVDYYDFVEQHKDMLFDD